MVQGSEFISLYECTGRGQHSQTLTQDLVKSLGWEVIHQNEGGAGVGARHWRLRGDAAFSQGIRGRANTAATPVENIRGQAWAEICQMCNIWRKHVGCSLEKSLWLTFSFHFTFSFNGAKNTGPDTVDWTLTPPVAESPCWTGNRARR